MLASLVQSDMFLAGVFLAVIGTIGVLTYMFGFKSSPSTDDDGEQEKTDRRRSSTEAGKSKSKTKDTAAKKAKTKSEPANQVCHSF